MHYPSTIPLGGVESDLKCLGGVRRPGIIRPERRNNVIQGPVDHRQRNLAVSVPRIRKIMQKPTLPVGKTRRPVFRVKHATPTDNLIPSHITPIVTASITVPIYVAVTVSVAVAAVLGPISPRVAVAGLSPIVPSIHDRLFIVPRVIFPGIVSTPGVVSTSIVSTGILPRIHPGVPVLGPRITGVSRISPHPLG